MELHEVTICEKGINPEAQFRILKEDTTTNKGDNMTEESETMNELQNVLERLSKRLDDADQAEAAVKASDSSEKSEDAEKIKILYGSAISNETDEFTNIEVPIIADDGNIHNQQLPKAMLTAIIKPRTEEIFELVKNRLNYLKIKPNQINKIILCGGGANLNNIRELASIYFTTNGYNFGF